MYIYSIERGTKNKFSICNYNVIFVEVVVNQDIKLMFAVSKSFLFVIIYNSIKI